ncbi:MAG: TonB-dependent receptor [Bacteroides sp.]
MKRIFISLVLFLTWTVGTLFAQSIMIKGTVLDEFNGGLPGANIMVKGSSNGAITDMDGNFSLQVPNEKSSLVVSFIGYKSKTVVVGKERNFKIKLDDNSQIVDEVVVVGFATQRKANNTGSVASVDAKKLQSRPITSAIEGLQGVAAGLNITNDNGGAPGKSMEMNIRGLGSIGEGSSAQPLILIDGVEGDLATVNPNDVESISVLKDGASASIYGSRAPFGVVLVTTRSGDKTTVINYSGSLRVAQPVSVPKSVDSYKYALYSNDCKLNMGENPTFGTGQLNKILAFQRGELPYATGSKIGTDGKEIWLPGPESWGNSDFYDIHLRNASYSQEHNASVSGGGERASYYFSTNYMKQSGIFRYADDSFSRFNISAKIGVKILKNLKLNYSMRFVNTTDDKPSALDALFFHNIGRITPLASLRTPNGEYTSESLVESLVNGGRQVQKQQQLYNQANFVYEPIKNWKIYLELGSRIENPKSTRQFKKIYQTMPDGRKEAIPVLATVLDRTEVNVNNGEFRRQPEAGVNYYEKSYGANNYFNTNVRTDYEFTYGPHFFRALLGMQTEYYSMELARVSSDAILLDDTPFLPSSQGVNPMMSEKKGEWASIGFFGRLNYVLYDRYLFEVNLRRDGASRFPTNQRWGLFPSFSLGWNMARENFFKPLADAGIETFKLRGSYSVLGNQNTSSFYPYYQKMYSQNGNFILGGNNVISLPSPEPYSTKLTWEKIENYGVGLDIVMFSNRFNASFDYYQRSTKDMVGPSKSLPAVYGANAPKTNNAVLRTRGWEFEALWRDRIGRDFNYEVNFSLSDYESVITKYDSPDGALDKYYAGKKLGDIWGYQVEGIAKNDLEMLEWNKNNNQDALGKKWGGGDLMYKDRDGNGKVNNGGNTLYDKGDLSVIGNGTPRFAYSFRLYAKYKFVDVSAFFQGIGKRDVFFNNSATFFGNSGEWWRSVFAEHMDYFRYAGDPLGENTDAYYARPRYDNNNKQVCDHYLQDASYLRLKNLQIGFTLPENIKLAKVIKKARLYVSGENLFTFTDLKIFDPEAIGSGISEYGPGKTYPMYRTFSVGLNVTF